VKADLIESLFPKRVGNDVVLTPDSIMRWIILLNLVYTWRL